MALIKCPDCGKMISEYAPACIQCGRPKDAPTSPSKPPESTKVVLASREAGAKREIQHTEKYVVKGYEKYISPCTFEELKMAHARGNYTDSDKVRTTTSSNWVALGTVLEGDSTAQTSSPLGGADDGRQQQGESRVWIKIVKAIGFVFVSFIVLGVFQLWRQWHIHNGGSSIIRAFVGGIIATLGYKIWRWLMKARNG